MLHKLLPYGSTRGWEQRAAAVPNSCWRLHHKPVSNALGIRHGGPWSRSDQPPVMRPLASQECDCSTPSSNDSSIAWRSRARSEHAYAPDAEGTWRSRIGVALSSCAAMSEFKGTRHPYSRWVANNINDWQWFGRIVGCGADSGSGAGCHQRRCHRASS